MTSVHEKSLALVDELFASVSDEQFMADYESVKSGAGPLLTDFFGAELDEYACFDIDYGPQHLDYSIPLQFSENFTYIHFWDGVAIASREGASTDTNFSAAANDCPYSLAA
ncbi:MAG: hypothetical protein RPU59_15555 [Candidatus Sedimenticola sp. (ex Thyasira tokunagai)]